MKFSLHGAASAPRVIIISVAFYSNNDLPLFSQKYLFHLEKCFFCSYSPFTHPIMFIGYLAHQVWAGRRDTMVSLSSSESSEENYSSAKCHFFLHSLLSAQHTLPHPLLSE